MNGVHDMGGMNDFRPAKRKVAVVQAPAGGRSA